MQDALLDDGNGEVRVYSVIFEPGARTYWHSHAAGQTLLVGSGQGMVETRDGDRRAVNAGDVVWAPPGEVHWHGAAPDSFLSHTAVSLGLTSWAEEVDEEHYRGAFGTPRHRLDARVGRVPAENRAGPAREVLAVRYGHRVTSCAESYLNFHLYGEPDADLDIDYYFWVIRDGGRVTLVDTGFAPEVGDRRRRAHYTTPAQALPALGIDPADVTAIVITHAHWDHIGNIGQFPHAAARDDRGRVRLLDLAAGRPRPLRRALRAGGDRRARAGAPAGPGHAVHRPAHAGAAASS